jgi:hypothetical protein
MNTHCLLYFTLRHKNLQLQAWREMGKNHQKKHRDGFRTCNIFINRSSGLDEFPRLFNIFRGKFIHVSSPILGFYPFFIGLQSRLHKMYT